MFIFVGSVSSRYYTEAVSYCTRVA